MHGTGNHTPQEFMREAHISVLSYRIKTQSLLMEEHTMKLSLLCGG
jgi:hypothetical protein